MNIPLIFWIVPAAAVIALAVAWAFYRSMKREDEGTPRMREIAEHVRKGAMAYLRQQYKVVLIVFIILALFFAYLAYGAGVQNPWVPFAFLTGGFFSGLAGYFGMKTATYASYLLFASACCMNVSYSFFSSLKCLSNTSAYTLPFLTQTAS